MATFQQLVEKNDKLRQKLRAFEHVKDFVEDLKAFDPEIVQEVLLDLDEFCVAPLVEEIAKIEGAKITKPRTTEKRDGKAKAEKKRKPGKAKEKGNRKRKGRA